MILMLDAVWSGDRGNRQEQDMSLFRLFQISMQSQDLAGEDFWEKCNAM